MAFIGRERELAALGGALQRASEGEPTRVCISGPLGIGITRLLDELNERIGKSNGVAFVSAKCYEPLSGVPYGALRHALSVALDAVPDDRLEQLLGSAAHDVATLIPEVAHRLERLGIEARKPRLDPQEQRGARVRESLFGVIGRLAAQRLLVLVVEDLEYSDPGTRQFISALLRVRRRLPLALIVGYHTDELLRGHPALTLIREIEDTPQVDKLRLEPLTRDETSSLMEALQGERPTLGFVAAVIEGSRGNPLLASQLVAAGAELAGLRLSDPFDDVLLARVAELDQGTVRALKLLAAARRPLTHDELAKVRLADGHLARNAAAAAKSSGFAAATRHGLAVIHELCAEAIEGSLLPLEKHALHAALAELTTSEPGQAAWHWERASRPAKAREAHLAAAAAATEVEPGETALLHYAAALELSGSEQEVDVA